MVSSIFVSTVLNRPFQLTFKHCSNRKFGCASAFLSKIKFSPQGFCVIGAHSDSPCLKLKPRSKLKRHGWKEIAVQTYGGGLWSTWFDRDLGIAGRVLVRKAGGGGEAKEVEQRLVQISKPVCRVPTLAVHMARGSGTKVEGQEGDPCT